MVRCYQELSEEYGDAAEGICADQYFRSTEVRKHFSIWKAKKKNINLDRIRKRHGYRGERLHEITGKIILENSEVMARKVSRMAKSDFTKKARKIAPGRRLTFPELDDVFPGRSVFIKKAAVNGRLISENLRQELGRKLRQSMREKGLTARAGVTAGRVRRDLIEDFEKKVHDVFESYTKKDPRIGMPPNVHTIAVTEARSAVNEIKEKYTKKLIDANGLKGRKRWIHNASLSKVPRRHHMALDGKEIEMDAKFKVKGPGGTVMMSRPHDPNAPIGEIASCNCDIEYLVSE